MWPPRSSPSAFRKKFTRTKRCSLAGERFACLPAELVDAAAGCGVRHLHGDGVKAQDLAQLIERHSMASEDIARQDGIGLVVEHVVLCEDRVGLELGAA